MVYNGAAMQKILTIMMAGATVLVCPAQEAAPEVARCLESYIGNSLAPVISQWQERSRQQGLPFSAELFVQQLQQALETGKAPEGAHPAAVDCAEKYLRFVRGDFDPAAAMQMLRDSLARAATDAPAMRRECERCDALLMQQYRPRCLKREQEREQKLLQERAAAPGTVAFSNGVLLQTEPGDTPFSQANRVTLELGVAYYTRRTLPLRFEDLPLSLRQIAPQVPVGSSWSFTIPGQAESAAAAQDGESCRMLALRLGNQISVLGGEARLPSACAIQPIPEGAPLPLIRLRIWREDPAKPYRAPADDFMHL